MDQEAQECGTVHPPLSFQTIDAFALSTRGALSLECPFS